jgi:hypothetical protein
MTSLPYVCEQCVQNCVKLCEIDVRTTHFFLAKHDIYSYTSEVLWCSFVIPNLSDTACDNEVVDSIAQ